MPSALVQDGYSVLIDQHAQIGVLYIGPAFQQVRWRAGPIAADRLGEARAARPPGEGSSVGAEGCGPPALGGCQRLLSCGPQLIAMGSCLHPRQASARLAAEIAPRVRVLLLRRRGDKPG
jgi:hypothetical protein